MRRSKTKALAKKKCDRYFSEYIRTRDKGKPCITCGRRGELDAGHFISRRFEATRYDEKNAHGQCLKCNRFEHGRQYEHGLAIDRLYGKGTAEALYTKSRMMCKRNQNDYEAIAMEFARKLGIL